MVIHLLMVKRNNKCFLPLSITVLIFNRCEGTYDCWLSKAGWKSNDLRVSSAYRSVRLRCHAEHEGLESGNGRFSAVQADRCDRKVLYRKHNMAKLGVSVIIPTFNRAHLISRAINSALAALESDDEIIVADDASTDNTETVIARFRAQYGDRIRYLKVPHGGAGSARNHGVRAATKPLIAFLDSDDEWMPDKIHLQRTFMEKRPDVLFCCSSFVSQLESGERTADYLRFWHHDSRSWDEILTPGVPYSKIADLPLDRSDFQVHVGDLYLAEFQSNYVATTTVMVRRVEAGSALLFAEDLRIAEDKECFARLAGAGPAAYFACDLSIQWGHSGPRLTDENAFASYNARLVLLDRIWGKDPNFMARHGNLFQQVKRTTYLDRARWLLVQGRNREARNDLRHAGASPLTFRFLASLPSPVSSTLLKLRRLVLRKTLGAGHAWEN
jgi:glycosyltransferase involved in cell wall biosynthesis